MPTEWWVPLVQAILGIPGTLDDLAQYLDAMYYTSTHGPEALLAGQNALWNPDFTGIESIVASGGWSWDSTVYYVAPGSGAAADQGSAKTECDGERRVLRSNLVEVSEGQVLQVSTRVATAGISGGGVSLLIAAYKADGSRDEYVIPDSSAVVVPDGPQTNWYGLPSGATTAVLSGGWKVLPDVVAVRQCVATEATTGTLWVDRGSLELGGLLSLLTRQLIWDDIAALTGAFRDYLFGDGVHDPLSDPLVPAMTSAWHQVLVDLGLSGPDMQRFWQNIWDGAIAAVVPKALLDIPDFFEALGDLSTAAFDFLLGGHGKTAWSAEAGQAFKDQLKIVVQMLLPANVQIDAIENFWGSLSKNILHQFFPWITDGASDIGDAFQQFLHPDGPTVPGLPVALAVPSLVGASVPWGMNYYCMTAVKDGIESTPSREAWVLVLLPLTEVVMTTTAVAGADEYRLYRGRTSRQWDRLVGTSSTPSVTDRIGDSGGTMASPPNVGTVAGSAVGGIVDNIYTPWFTPRAVGVPGGTMPDRSSALEDIRRTIASMSTAVFGDYTAYPATASTTRDISAADDVVLVCIGAGENGPAGATYGIDGGFGGSFSVTKIRENGVDRIAGLSNTLYVVPGASNGAESYVYHGSISSGTRVARSGTPGTLGFTVGPFGYEATASLPGRGGSGGAIASRGERGLPSALATGGKGGGYSGTGASGGSLGTGGDGSPGGSGGAGGTLGSGIERPCGGGGGAGGGAGGNGGDGGSGGGKGGPGGRGGDGGFPGGGGGAGGAAGLGGTSGIWGTVAANGTPGGGGTGAQGIVWVLTK